MSHIPVSTECMIQVCANKGEYVELIPPILDHKIHPNRHYQPLSTQKKNYKYMYKCNVLSVSTAYMYTAYKQGMFVISVQLSGTYSKYTVITQIFNEIELVLSSYSHETFWISNR